MKYIAIFFVIILLTLSGCQSIKKNSYAIIVTPIELPVTPEKDKNPFFPLYDSMSLYDFLKNKNYRVETVSKDPLIYRIPGQKGLLEELAKMIKTVRSMINVCYMNVANAKTTKTSDNAPYRRKVCIINKDFEVEKIGEVPGDLKMVYDPEHPDTNSEGYLYYPNVNEIEEKLEISRLQSLENAIIKIIERTNHNSVAL